MIKTKYYAVYYMQKMWAIELATWDVCNFLCEKLPPEESKALNKVLEELIRISDGACWEMRMQFPELRQVEFLWEMKEKVKYNIKCQDTVESQEQVVRRGLSADEANDELERYRNEHAGYSGMIWLELDGDSTNAMLEYFAMRKRENQKRLEEKKKQCTLASSELIPPATPF
jgi:hypothetical protein